MAVPAGRLGDLLRALEGRAPAAAVVGVVEEGQPGAVRVR